MSKTETSGCQREIRWQTSIGARLYQLVHGEIMENKMTLDRRWVICIGCIVLFLSGYFGSQLTTTPAQANALDATTSTNNNSQLLISSTDLETGKQITIIDVKSKAISVYLIERGTGKIQLLSTRNAHWDFQLDEYNSGNPTPREIQQLISQWKQKDFGGFCLSFATNKGQAKGVGIPNRRTGNLCAPRREKSLFKFETTFSFRFCWGNVLFS